LVILQIKSPKFGEFGTVNPLNLIEGKNEFFYFSHFLNHAYIPYRIIAEVDKFQIFTFTKPTS